MANYILSNCNFIHIPKCGGSAINRALRRLGTVTDTATQALSTPHYGHLFAAQMPENGKPFFSFVRHPVSWWMSFYHWNMNPVHSRFSPPELATTSFDQWINEYGPFWLGFYTKIVRRYLGKDLAFPSVNKVETVGRTEYLYTDLRSILNVLGQPYDVDVMTGIIAGTLKLDPKTENRQTYDRKAVSMASRELIHKCEMFMYEKFGYSI